MGNIAACCGEGQREAYLSQDQDPALKIEKQKYESIREQYEKAGQGHVFTYFDELSAEEQAHLLSEAGQINPN